jgi:polysaccharide chain length determinant protein (PEP-CTERM system associated)
MQQVLTELMTYVGMVWRRRWIILGVTWVCSVIGWLIVATIPDVYESRARVYIDTDSILAPLMRGLAVEMDVFQQVDIMQRTLFSRPNIEKVMLMTDLDLTVNTPEERETLLQTISENLVLGQQGLNLFQVAYQDEDRELTKKVIQSVLSIFVESNLGASRTDMDQTRAFLDDQVADYQKKLEDAERQIADFKKENMELLPGSGDFFSQLESSRAQYAATEQQLKEATISRDLMKTQLAAIPQYVEVPGAVMSDLSLPPGASLGPPSNLAVRIIELETRIDTLLMNYTEKHPDVVAARKLLDQLKAQMQAEDEAAAAQMAALAAEEAQNPVAAAPTPTAPNPVYEQLQLQLINQENIIATLQGRLATAGAQLGEWETRASTVPYIEAEFRRLQRDYDLIREKYAELRQRQEAAMMAEEVETKTNKVQFRIVDPPQVPISPIGPNRPMLLSGVFAVSLGIGVAIGLLLGLMKGSFHSTHRMRMSIPLPVLGSVSAVLSGADRRRQAMAYASFAVIGSGLLFTYASLIIVESLSGNLAIEAMVIAERLHLTFVFDMLKDVIAKLNLT